MPKYVKPSPTINQERMTIIAKGFANRQDLQRFIPASKGKASTIYEYLVRKSQLENKLMPFMEGVDISVVLEFMHMTEEDIRRRAEYELQMERQA